MDDANRSVAVAFTRGQGRRVPESGRRHRSAGALSGARLPKRRRRRHAGRARSGTSGTSRTPRHDRRSPPGHAQQLGRSAPPAARQALGPTGLGPWLRWVGSSPLGPPAAARRPASPIGCAGRPVGRSSGTARPVVKRGGCGAPPRGRRRPAVGGHSLVEPGRAAVANAAPAAPPLGRDHRRRDVGRPLRRGLADRRRPVSCTSRSKRWWP